MSVSDYRGDNLVFVVGAPRSGTTWLQRMLAAHPSLRTGQESDVFDAYIGPQLRAWRRDASPAPGERAVGLAAYFDERRFMDVLRSYMRTLLEPMVGGLEPGELFLEKTPSHALFLPEIAELLPEARVVHVVRDARDVAASIVAASRTWGASWAPSSPGAAAWMWVEHVRAVRDAAPALDGRLLEVRYEDMVGDASGELRRVLDFLGLTWDDDAVAEAAKANALDAARSGASTAIPLGGAFAEQAGSSVVEPEGFVRRGVVGGWRDELGVLDRVRVWRVAGREMGRMGYPWPLPR